MLGAPRQPTGVTTTMTAPANATVTNDTAATNAHHGASMEPNFQRMAVQRKRVANGYGHLAGIWLRAPPASFQTGPGFTCRAADRSARRARARGSGAPRLRTFRRGGHDRFSTGSRDSVAPGPAPLRTCQ